MKAIGDMKEGLIGARPKLSILGKYALIAMCRGMEYGAAKYARGNYHGDPPTGVQSVDRFLGYLDASMRHLTAISQAINVAKGTGGDATTACSVVDDESSSKFPPSMLPHIAHALASLMIAVEVGVADGLLPADPGQPWSKGKRQDDIPQKDDPDAEHRRVSDFLDHEKRIENGTYPERRKPNQ
jgi:Domain of unknown function (DUF5664)